MKTKEVNIAMQHIELWMKPTKKQREALNLILSVLYTHAKVDGMQEMGERLVGKPKGKTVPISWVEKP